MYHGQGSTSQEATVLVTGHDVIHEMVNVEAKLIWVVSCVPGWLDALKELIT